MRKLTWQFISFLEEIYQDHLITEDTKRKSSKIHFLDLDLKELWGALGNKWGYLDKSALDINEIIEEYKSRKTQWYQLLDEKKKFSDREFVLKHSEYKEWLKSQDREGKLDDFTIQTEKEAILLKPRPIALELDEKFIEWNRQKIYSFKIYEKSPFRLNLHIKHEKRYFHDLLLFFTISINNPSDKTFSMEFINSYYTSFISMYEIIDYLKSNNYNEAFVSFFDDYEERDLQILMTSKKKPFLFKVYYLFMIHNSLEDMFELLSIDLEKIQEIIRKLDSIQKPMDYYTNFEGIVKDYLEKGRQLFLKSEDLFYQPKNIAQKIVKKSSKKRRLSEEELVDMFQLEYEKDISLKLEEGNRGFRSLPEIFKLYEIRLKMSWKTFNDKALVILDKSSKFEQRNRNKVGGGKEFRIKKEPIIDATKDANSGLVPEDLTQEDYDIILLYEQTKILHNDGQIDNVINIFEQIIENYGSEFKKYSWIYCDVCQRLASIYENIGNLNDAEILYKKAKDNITLTNSSSLTYSIANLKIEILRGNYEGLNSRILEFEDILRKNMEKSLLELNTKYTYIEGTNIEDLDLYYIRDLKHDKSFSSYPIFQEVIQIDLDLLMIQLLKLDIIRREVYLESLKSFKNEMTREEKINAITPSMMKLLEEADSILERVNHNKFNWGNKNFGLFRIYRAYFNNFRGEYDVIEEGFDFQIHDTYFPRYRTKFLFNLANYEIRDIQSFVNRLSQQEFFTLDLENKVEYLIKFCNSNWMEFNYRIVGDAKINQYKNNLTLINYAVYLVDKFNLEDYKIPIKKVQNSVERLVKNFIEGYEKRAERLRNRRKTK
ncbi:MAG: hypothetical protein ACFE88_13850 [Candidatus Hermodarchaeota archaeon]